MRLCWYRAQSSPISVTKELRRTCTWGERWPQAQSGRGVLGGCPAGSGTGNNSYDLWLGSSDVHEYHCAFTIQFLIAIVFPCTHFNTRSGPVGHSNPLPSSLPPRLLPSSLLPQSPLLPPSSPGLLPFLPTLPSPPAASSLDAAPPSAAAKLTLGGPDGHSDPLPLSQPLQPARSPPQSPPLSWWVPRRP